MAHYGQINFPDTTSLKNVHGPIAHKWNVNSLACLSVPSIICPNLPFQRRFSTSLNRDLPVILSEVQSVRLHNLYPFTHTRKLFPSPLAFSFISPCPSEFFHLPSPSLPQFPLLQRSNYWPSYLSCHLLKFSKYCY